jgi:uncharacterized protein (DUF1499 family)
MTALRLLLGRGTGGLPPPAPVDFAALVLPSSPNVHLAVPPGSTAQRHEAVPLLPVTPERAWDAVRTLGDRFPRVWKMAEWPELRQAQWVARSRLANFPDLVNAAVVELPGGAGLYLYSRSLLGYSDFGVNRRRVAAWRAGLDEALRSA